MVDDWFRMSPLLLMRIVPPDCIRAAGVALTSRSVAVVVVLVREISCSRARSSLGAPDPAEY
jgi:hypothetical protein